MLPRASRLRRKRDIEHVRTKGHRATTRLLRARFARASGSDSHATVVVSQRVARTAVARNRLKRKIRSLLKTPLSSLTTPADVIISAQNQALHATNTQLAQALQSLFGHVTATLA